MTCRSLATAFVLSSLVVLTGAPDTWAEGRLREALIARRAASSVTEDSGKPSRREMLEEKPSSRPEEVDTEYDGRVVKLYVPKNLPPMGQRAMVAIFHGGGANGSFMQASLQMNLVADKYGFVVAYLNGTKAASMLPSRMRSWNAGDCCGKAHEDQVDDVTYITNAINHLNKTYGIDPSRVYAIGHSNGSMMSQLLACTTTLFPASVAISGPLSSEVTSCPGAKSKRVLAIHGRYDENVPLEGGKGTKGPNKVKQDVNFRAEASAKEIYERSGASFTLDVVEDTDHSLQNLDAAVAKRDGYGISEKAARFFGLAR